MRPRSTTIIGICTGTLGHCPVLNLILVLHVVDLLGVDLLDVHVGVAPDGPLSTFLVIIMYGFRVR